MRCIFCAGIRPQASVWVNDDHGKATFKPYAHHPSFSSLQLSAASGCDLCALFERYLVLDKGSLQAIEACIVKHGTSAITLYTDFRYPNYYGNLWIELGHTTEYRTSLIRLQFEWFCERGDEAARCKHIFGRDVPIDPLSDECLDTMKSWIQKCLDCHDRCPYAIEEDLPSRLIDVGEDPPFLLVTKGQRGSYIALSHCWGGRETTTTTKATLEQRMRGIPLNEMASNFRDAVMLSRRLGSRYLWIDTLCIIQDDAADWAKESVMMGRIYSHAKLTIAASMARDSHQGFLQKREICSVENALASIAYRDECMEKEGTLHLRLYEGDYRWETGVEDGILNTRGWTMQERVLSSRTLHFGKSQVYWECHASTNCESGMDAEDELYSKSKLEISEIIKRSEKRELDKHSKQTSSYSLNMKGCLDQEAELRKTKEKNPEANSILIVEKELHISTLADNTSTEAGDMRISSKSNFQVDDRLAYELNSDEANIANKQVEEFATEGEKLTELKVGSPAFSITSYPGCMTERKSTEANDPLLNKRHEAKPNNRVPDSICSETGEISKELQNLYVQWLLLVQMYSGRILTVRSDKFVALLALIDIFQAKTDDEFLAGVWRKDLLRGLLWEGIRSTASSSNNSPSATSQLKAAKTTIQHDNPKTSYIAPSWSWASFHGRVYYGDSDPSIADDPKAVDAKVLRAQVTYKDFTAPGGGSTPLPTGSISSASLVLETYVVWYKNAQFYAPLEGYSESSLAVESEAGAKQVIEYCCMDQYNPPRYPKILLAMIRSHYPRGDHGTGLGDVFALVLVPSLNEDETAACMQYDGDTIPIMTRVGIVSGHPWTEEMFGRWLLQKICII